MNSGLIAGLAAVSGSIVGAFGSVVGTWITTRHQDLRDLLAKKIVRREALYSDFITESARLLVDALQHNTSDPLKLIPAYALLSRIRLSSSSSVLAKAEDKKADPSGTWKWSFTGQGGQTRETTLKLKLDGEKLTGTVSGRGGETAIAEAKLKGEEISFQVTREFNGNKVTTKYNGKISGDTIKGKMEFERDGQAQSRDWEAKRAAEKANEAK